MAKLLYALEVTKQDIEGEESLLDAISPEPIIEFAEGVMPRKMIALGKERYYLLRSFLYRFSVDRKLWAKLQDEDPAIFGVKEIDGHDYIRLSFMSDLLLGYLRMYRLKKGNSLRRIYSRSQIFDHWNDKTAFHSRKLKNNTLKSNEKNAILQKGLLDICSFGMCCICSPVSKITNPLRDQWIGILTKVGFPLAFAIFSFTGSSSISSPTTTGSFATRLPTAKRYYTLDTSVVKILDKVNECKKGDVK